MFLFVAMTLTCFVHVYLVFSCYLVFYQQMVNVTMWCYIFGFGVTYLSRHSCVLLWCFINMTILFGVIAILANYNLVIDYIINIIVSMTFLFGVTAISPYPTNN